MCLPRAILQWDGGTMAKTASERLAEEIALAQLRKKIPPLFTPEDLGGRPTPEELPMSLWLHGELDEPTLVAFNAFGLDHRSVSDWHALVSHLARVLFPKRRPPGAPRRWTDERLCLLLAHVAACKRKDPEASDTAICIRIKKKWPKESPGTLRRVLQYARDPALNGVLARMAYDRITQQMLREAAAACGVTVTKDAFWTEAEEKNIVSKAVRAAVEKAIEEADKLWGH
jgi:hypothetical protein